jgi:uncharacterized protein
VTNAEVVDTLCNAFLPGRAELWTRAIAGAGLPLKVQSDPNDGFCDAPAMVDRMDELGIATILLPTTDIGGHGRLDPLDFEHMASRWDEVERMTAGHPGRFAALAIIDPTRGHAGVRETRARLNEPWVAGLYLHTHSWDRRFDHADLYPWYALAADAGVPVGVQAGTSGGLLASECGRPIGIDRPALYFPEVPFVLSHTGWPWVDEAVAMALKFPNVYLGTGSYPPRHWPGGLVEFLRGPGRSKVLFATNFPTVGHRRALTQLDDLDLKPETRTALLGGTARRIYTRLPAATG